MVTSNDITARKRAQEAARRSEKELRDVIETVPAMLWSSLPDGSLDFINRRWQEFTGLAAEDALGWTWEAVVHPEDHGRFVADWRAALAEGQPIESELRVRAANGEYRWLLVRNVPLRDELGKIVKWYGTSFDIHERKRAEEALHRSEAYLAEAQKLTHTGSYAYDGRTNTFPYWSEEHFRIWGFDPQQGPPDGETPPHRVHRSREMACELSAMSERSTTSPSTESFYLMEPLIYRGNWSSPAHEVAGYPRHARRRCHGRKLARKRCARRCALSHICGPRRGRLL
jgi:PAS domain S-box-containing protein